jgi:tRNA-5-methyluridine54 2-sulfurtransferase
MSSDSSVQSTFDSTLPLVGDRQERDTNVPTAVGSGRVRDAQATLLPYLKRLVSSPVSWFAVMYGCSVVVLYLSLGIGAYSERSKAVCQAFADARGATLLVGDLAGDHGYTIPEAAGTGGRSSCGVCGLSKRYVFNRAALDGGYDVVCTGHNLDDEAAVLFGNTLRWDTAAMARQFPVLEATRPGLVKKVKPLYRVAERETAAYCVLKGIDYVVEECPLVAGNTQMRHKETLNQMEEAAPGTKHSFLFGYLDRAADLLKVADVADLTECARCGMVTQAPEDPAAEAICAFCRSKARLVKTLPVVEVNAG